MKRSQVEGFLPTVKAERRLNILTGSDVVTSQPQVSPEDDICLVFIVVIFGNYLYI